MHNFKAPHLRPVIPGESLVSVSTLVDLSSVCECFATDPVNEAYYAGLWNSRRPLAVGLPSNILDLPSRASFFTLQPGTPVAFAMLSTKRPTRV
jgi:hypothetical protein